MTIILTLVLIAALFGALIGGTVFWLIVQRRQAARTHAPTSTLSPAPPRLHLPFRWRYIALPVIFLILTIIMTAVFYARLPDPVAYHFTDGEPDAWLGRGAIIAWLLLPQVFFTVLAAMIVWGTLKVSAFFPQTNSGLVSMALTLMGNMIALPQIILAFAMLDIFSYNSYGIHLMPLWTFALMIMVLGAIVLGAFFIIALQRARSARKIR